MCNKFFTYKSPDRFPFLISSLHKRKQPNKLTTSIPLLLIYRIQNRILAESEDEEHGEVSLESHSLMLNNGVKFRKCGYCGITVNTSACCYFRSRFTQLVRDMCYFCSNPCGVTTVKTASAVCASLITTVRGWEFALAKETINTSFCSCLRNRWYICGL